MDKNIFEKVFDEFFSSYEKEKPNKNS